MTAHLEVDSISKRYGAVTALNQVSLAVEQGAYVVLLGPSGSGKTTLLSVIGGFTVPTSGRVSIAGRDVTAMSPAQRPTTTLFQDYALFPHMSVAGNVGFGLKVRRVPGPEREKRIAAALELVGLAGYGGRGIHEISGGQRQRVALARALVVEPEILLLDEPLGALDLNLRRQMQDELLALQRADPDEIETTLVIHPHTLTDFLDFNDFLGAADALIEDLSLEGELQFANFHPQYQFGGTEPDDITNYTNRSPYPTMHILRESSIERATETMEDTDAIFEKNIETMETLGLAGWQALGLR